jgi:AcrR family transcriptional regulator
METVYTFPTMLVKVYTRSVMPYPAKTNAQTILTTAITYIEQNGIEALSMRVLAATLGLTPHALYRHYPDRAALEAAIANEGMNQLQAVLATATTGRKGLDALRYAAHAYLNFARTHRALYNMLMQPHEAPTDSSMAEHSLWHFVVNLIEDRTALSTEASADATVALWAFLHGFVELEQADVFGGQKPRSGFEAGLKAFLAGLASEKKEVGDM